MKRRHAILGLACIASVAFAGFFPTLRRRVRVQRTGGRSIREVIGLYGTSAEARLRVHFESAGQSYPPQEIALLGLKAEKQLELWAHEKGDWIFIHSYPILKASGKSGPKLREGDRQVPEGLYRILSLNPNSSFHLSMKLNYPNDSDLKHAKAEGRDQPGSDIFIHGKAVSIGCLAMGDPAIEELFVLVEKVGVKNVRVLLAPHDPRERGLHAPEDGPAWLPERYHSLEAAFAEFKKPAF